MPTKIHTVKAMVSPEVLAAESMDRRTWRATIHRVTYNLNNWACMHTAAVKNSRKVPHKILYIYKYMEKAMAPHSSTLAWKIPWTEEPGRLQSMGSWRVRHDWVTSLSLFTFVHWRRKWQPTPVLAWRIPGTVEPGGLPSMGSHRVGHDWSDLAAAYIYIFSFLCMCINISHLFYSFICWHLGCFHVLFIVNNASLNKKVLVSFRNSEFISSRYTHKQNCWIIE